MGRVCISGSFLLASALAAPSAFADATGAAPLGISLGLRSGWAFPMGALEKGDSQSSNFTGMLPVWFDAGYRWSDQIYTGAYFQWAPLFVSDDVCTKNLRCSGDDLRFGINVHWHFKRLIQNGDWGGPFDPWIGLGTGYESALVHLETLLGAKSQQTHHGFEFANLQVGGDYLGGPLHVGAFMSLSLAEYTRLANTTPIGTQSFAVSDPAVHLWFFLGVRGQYDL